MLPCTAGRIVQGCLSAPRLRFYTFKTSLLDNFFKQDQVNRVVVTVWRCSSRLAARIYARCTRLFSWIIWHSCRMEPKVNDIFEAEWPPGRLGLYQMGKQSLITLHSTIPSALVQGMNRHMCRTHIASPSQTRPSGSYCTR